MREPYTYSVTARRLGRRREGVGGTLVDRGLALEARGVPFGTVTARGGDITVE